VESRIVDCMPMLGGGPSAVGNFVFRSLLSITPVYDGFHFSQLRGHGLLGRLMDRAAVKVMLPRLIDAVEDYAPDLMLSVFATGASAAAHLKRERPDLATVVFMTDSFAHGMWAHEGTDLFLVTSDLAAASVRRYCPEARVSVVEAPVRPDFYAAPSQAAARALLQLPTDVPCVLLMSGAWGLGPLDDIARALASEGWWVLAVSGSNESLHARLAAVARDYPRLHTFGYTDQIPSLMAARATPAGRPGSSGDAWCCSMSCPAMVGRTSCTSWSWATPPSAFPRRPRWSVTSADSSMTAAGSRSTRPPVGVTVSSTSSKRRVSHSVSLDLA